MYAGVERLNDLSEEEMASLKQTCTDMNTVTFSGTATAVGTRLLIARETGKDKDFVSIFSLYKGDPFHRVRSPFSAIILFPVISDSFALYNNTSGDPMRIWKQAFLTAGFFFGIRDKPTVGKTAIWSYHISGSMILPNHADGTGNMI